MSQVPDQHRAESPRTVRCAVITVSDTRSFETDTGGQTIVDMLTAAGHQVVHRHLIRDEPAPMRALLESLREDPEIDAILMTGGTGLGSRDQTFETVSALLDKPLPGFGELFRMLSYQEIGAAAMLSRATGGLIGARSSSPCPAPGGACSSAMANAHPPRIGASGPGSREDEGVSG